MKDIKTSLLESNDDKFFFTEVQNEITNEAGYRTLSFEKTNKKYKMGFVSFNENDEFVAVCACNTGEDFANLLGMDEDAYDELGKIEVGETKELKGETYLRIW